VPEAGYPASNEAGLPRGDHFRYCFAYPDCLKERYSLSHLAFRNCSAQFGFQQKNGVNHTNAR
jgi:hypothetical protein